MKLPKKLPNSLPKKAPAKPSPPPFSVRPSLPPPPVRSPAAKPKSKPAPIPYAPSREPPRKSLLERESEVQKEKNNARAEKWRSPAVIVCGLAAFGIGVYTIQLWRSLSQEPDWENIPKDVSDRFDKEAEGYDEKVNTAERMLGLTSKRQALTERVKGHVLEVAVGTGRNFAYYPTKQCDTVTFLDSSGPMLAVARRKWKESQPEYFNRVFFKQQSALDPITPPFGAQEGYDTVLQTMGLCSTPEPERLLQSLEAATKEGGQILLLEHGKSHYEWLNGILDKTAPSHAMEHGCWWNKDIGKIVEDSGLEVVEIKRYNFGTTWWVELQPRKGYGYKQPILEQIREAVAPASESPVSQKPWWVFWR